VNISVSKPNTATMVGERCSVIISDSDCVFENKGDRPWTAELSSGDDDSVTAELTMSRPNIRFLSCKVTSLRGASW
jgi:hypothetical protein